MADSHARYIHALRSIPGIGDRTLSTFLEQFGNAENLWRAENGAVTEVLGVPQEKKDVFLVGRRALDPDLLWDKLATQGIAAHEKSDALYPNLLREIPDAPLVIYTRGTFDWTKKAPLIAIVGSRKHSAYGVQVAEKLAADLTHAGLVVVSGMAFGIDSVAHKSALTAGGETIAVLGSGIDDPMISPVSHFGLARNIMQNGALLSEYAPGTQAHQGSFPMRDRIIAGLTLGTIVIEAPEKSGSLITATCALEYNREVFAVPGSIFSPYSIGTNTLIKRGAKLVIGVEDILEELREEMFLRREANNPLFSDTAGLTDDEKLILYKLGHEPLHIDKIIKATKLETAKVSSLLSILEIKGLAKNIGGMHYVKVGS